ncbi:hypothetical protein Hanom_Chr15g01391651 [Helianthus anomalus]
MSKYIDLIAKIVPEVWTDLPFSSKMTLLYQIAPNVYNFLPFSSKTEDINCRSCFFLL